MSVEVILAPQWTGDGFGSGDGHGDGFGGGRGDGYGYGGGDGGFGGFGDGRGDGHSDGGGDGYGGGSGDGSGDGHSDGGGYGYGGGGGFGSVGKIATIFGVTSAHPFMTEMPGGPVELKAGALLLREPPPWADSSFPRGGHRDPQQVTLRREDDLFVATYMDNNTEITAQGPNPGSALAALGEALQLVGYPPNTDQTH